MFFNQLRRLFEILLSENVIDSKEKRRRVLRTFVNAVSSALIFKRGISVFLLLHISAFLHVDARQCGLCERSTASYCF